MQIHLDLRDHCIATEMKKRYNQCLSHYFKRKGNTALLEAEIECLKHALENLDFPGLRSRYPDLSGHKEVGVMLSCTQEYGLSLTLDGNSLDLLFITPKDVSP